MIFNYLVRYWVRCRGRVLLTLAGISVSISAIVFAYGVSGWVDHFSSRSLSFVLGNSSIWVVPAEGVELDSKTGLIIAKGFIPPDTIRAIYNANSDIQLISVIAGPILLEGKQIILYGDEREGDTTDLLASSDIWAELGGKVSKVFVEQQGVTIASERNDLPPRSILTSIAEARRLLNVEGVSWLISNNPRAARWAQSIQEIPGLEVTSSPVLGKESSNNKITVYLIHGTVSRFDPFSFRTKFSALTINSSMATLFGVVARVVFLLGIALAITSVMIGLHERRDEIALFAVAGFESNVITLFLTEACVTQTFCFVTGSGIGLCVLWFVLGNGLSVDIIGQALGFGVVYLPILIVVTTIIPGQSVARNKPVELLRRSI